MIDKIKFKNYKAFDEGEIEIRPLTFLLGANSSGKSSILHLFLMLEQTISNADKYNAALKTNGHSVSLGEDENLLKDRKREKQLHLEFGINAAEYIKNVKALQKEIVDNSTLQTILLLDREGFHKYIIKDNKKDSDSIYNLVSILKKRSKNLDERKWGKKFDYPKQDSFLSSIKSCTNVFDETFNPSPDSASIKYVLTFNETFQKLKVTECHVIVGGKVVVKILTKENNSLILSDIFKKEDLDNLTPLSKDFHFEFDGLSIQSLSEHDNPFTDYIMTLVKQAFQSVQDFFSKKNMNYVGPLRANPQRYYILDDSNSNTTFDHRSGVSLAEVLKKNKSVRDKINNWLKPFELNVDVKEFKDVIHNIKVTQNNLLLDIPDVGFGISQVLPILVEGMMAPPSATIIMEQPEIHLHPKMQAELADLFIDILQLQTKRKSRINKHLIIETHSEYIIKRIRRRMAEGLISPKDVAIYFVNPRNKEHPDTAEIQLAPISEDGTIEWPEEFYMTELEDEMAFFKAKMRKS